MKCIIPGSNAVVFSKAIQSLARVGPELHLKALKDELQIRAINSSKTAFLLVAFKPTFFLHYFADCSNKEYNNKCKVSIKTLLEIFKNTKMINRFSIIMDDDNNQLVFKLECRFGAIKTHYLNMFQLEERLKTVCLTKDVPFQLTACNRLFIDMVNNFQHNVEEITMELSKDFVLVKNNVKKSCVDVRYMRSLVMLEPAEFDKYNVPEETNITFCVKELRSVLSFADSLKLNITMNFEATGRPVVFASKKLPLFEAQLVTATLHPGTENHTTNNSNLAIVKANQARINKMLETCIAESSIRSYTPTAPRQYLPYSDSVFTMEKDNELRNKSTELSDSELEEIHEISDDSSNEISNAEDDILLQSSPNRKKLGPSIAERSIRSSPTASTQHAAYSASAFTGAKCTELHNKSNENIQNMNTTTNNNSHVEVGNTESEEKRVIFRDDSSNEMQNAEDEVVLFPSAPKRKIRRALKNVFHRCFDATLTQYPTETKRILAEHSDSDFD